MQTFLAVFLFFLGIFFTVFGGDSFVLAASRISEILRIPKFIVGATIVSVSANTGLILAFSIIFMPCTLEREKLGFKFFLLVLSVSMLLLFSRSGYFILPGVCLLLCFFAAFIFENLRAAVTRSDEVFSGGEGIVFSWVRLCIGAAAIVFGAELLIDKASYLGIKFGIDEAVISTLVLAIGTSLPELITTLCAIRRRESSLSVGNIIGANIIDLTLILPACSLLSGKPLAVPRQALVLSMPACLILICIAVFPTVLRGKFTRGQGIFLFLSYITYIILTALAAESL